MKIHILVIISLIYASFQYDCDVQSELQAFKNDNLEQENQNLVLLWKNYNEKSQFQYFSQETFIFSVFGFSITVFLLSIILYGILKSQNLQVNINQDVLKMLNVFVLTLLFFSLIFASIWLQVQSQKQKKIICGIQFLKSHIIEGKDDFIGLLNYQTLMKGFIFDLKKIKQNQKFFEKNIKYHLISQINSILQAIYQKLENQQRTTLKYESTKYDYGEYMNLDNPAIHDFEKIINELYRQVHLQSRSFDKIQTLLNENVFFNVQEFQQDLENLYTYEVNKFEELINQQIEESEKQYKNHIQIAAILVSFLFLNLLVSATLLYFQNFDKKQLLQKRNLQIAFLSIFILLQFTYIVLFSLLFKDFLTQQRKCGYMYNLQQNQDIKEKNLSLIGHIENNCLNNQANGNLFEFFIDFSDKSLGIQKQQYQKQAQKIIQGFFHLNAINLQKTPLYFQQILKLQDTQLLIFIQQIDSVQKGLDELNILLKQCNLDLKLLQIQCKTQNCQSIQGINDTNQCSLNQSHQEKVQKIFNKLKIFTDQYTQDIEQNLIKDNQNDTISIGNQLNEFIKQYTDSYEKLKNIQQFGLQTTQNIQQIQLDWKLDCRKTRDSLIVVNKKYCPVFIQHRRFMVVFIIMSILLTSILFLTFVQSLQKYYNQKKSGPIHDTTFIDIRFNEKIPYKQLFFQSFISKNQS